MIHTLGGVNYRARCIAVGAARTVDGQYLHEGWHCRWELNDGSHGDWCGPYNAETHSVSAAQEDFVNCAVEPFNTEAINDR